MGCSSSSRVNVSSLASVVIPDDSYTGSRYWVRSLTEKEARDDFEADGIFKCAPDRTLLELRALLDYPIGRQSLSKNCLKSNPCVHILLAGWLDIQRYNAMMPGSSKLELAYSINKTYIQPSSLFPSDQILGFNEVLNSPEKIQSGIFDETQSLMFTKFHDLFFLQFISTPEYDQMCCALRRKYNRVKQSDFLYHQIIGKGGFGVVAEVSKKSTGVRYAMKLQRKDQLACCFGDQPWRVHNEKRCISSCHHPFIVELHFSFQTDKFVIMLFSLGTGRDLSSVLKACGPLTMEQVRFYAAEITSALSYIHDKGLVYRDLKPGNVLLNMDGHIQLVDFGGVADTNKHGSFAPENISPVLTPEDAAANLTDRQPPLSHYWSNNKPTREDSAKDGDDFVLASSFGGFDADSIRSLCHAASPRVMRTLKDTFPDLDEFFILRHLSVCDGDLEKTVVHIENCLRWRYSFLNYDKVPRHQASGSGGFWYTHGYDCLGHPLLIYTSRLMSPDNRDMDEFVRWIVWMYEIAIKRMPPDVHRVTILVNRLGQKQTDFESQRTMFPLFRKMYPNIVYKFIFYPASIALRAASGVIKNFAGRAAINTHVLNSIAALRKEIPDEYIPEEMGGSCSYKFDIADYPSPEICEPNEYVIEKSSELTTMASAVTTYRPGETSDLVPVELGNSNPMSMSQPGVPIAPPAEGFLQRSNSIVGSHGYMAPEVVVLMSPVNGFQHSGYTQAVDWWSLGVTMYRLLTGAHPFKTDIPKPITREQRIFEGSDRYALLLEKVNYSHLEEQPVTVDIISRLLVVDDTERLGYGPDGSKAVSAHKFFGEIDWVELEQKMSVPPPLPAKMEPMTPSPYSLGLEKMMQAYHMEAWLKNNFNGKPTLQQQELLRALNGQLDMWDFAANAAVDLELENP